MKVVLLKVLVLASAILFAISPLSYAQSSSSDPITGMLEFFESVISFSSCTSDSECDDGNPCTLDFCESPGTVFSECYNVMSATCTDDDGCCSPICEGKDTDCEPKEPLMHCSFDNTLTCSDGVGPHEGTELYGQGIQGQAYDSEAGLLRYFTNGNFYSVEGTVMMWVKPRWDSLDGENHMFFNVNPTGAANQFALYKWGDNRLIFSTRDSEGSLKYDVSYTPDWDEGEWHHLTITWDIFRSTSQYSKALYVDGRLVAHYDSVISDTNPNYAYLSIGSQVLDGNLYPADSLFDDLKIYNFPMDAQEIRDAYNEYPVCGNGVIDPGETCDRYDSGGHTCSEYGYPGGELYCNSDCSGFDFGSSCYVCTSAGQETHCDDGDSCTIDICEEGGSPGSYCRHSQITSCMDDDGCCLPGCKGSDNDCAEPACGDGTKDPGEECDDGNTDDGDGCSGQCGYEYTWHVIKIGADKAFDITRGSPDVVIAVIDTGFLYNKMAGCDWGDDPSFDLGECDDPSYFWTNQDEVPGNGKDDDNNGYIDDMIGWDFFENDSIVYPSDSNYNPKHGTTVSYFATGEPGIYGSMGFYEATTGICPGCRVMPIKTEGNGYSEEGMTPEMIASSIRYAVDNGADIVSMSLVGSASLGQDSVYAQQEVQDAIDYAYAKGVLFVGTAGNEQREGPEYPAYFDRAIAVGATDRNDGRGYFSDYGERIELSAPGTSVLAPKWFGEYSNAYLGTSYATPLVSGTAGLMKSVKPALTNKQMMGIILRTANDITTDQPIGPRLNTYQAVLAASQYSPRCGNGIIDPGEQCDCGSGECKQYQLDYKTCTYSGFGSGQLGCVPAGIPSQCKFDTSYCTGIPVKPSCDIQSDIDNIPVLPTKGPDAQLDISMRHSLPVGTEYGLIVYDTSGQPGASDSQICNHFDAGPPLTITTEGSQNIHCEWSDGLSKYNREAITEGNYYAQVYIRKGEQWQELCGDWAAILAVSAECGNGIVEDGEGCDDGNLIDGDGCSAACEIEKKNVSGNVKDMTKYSEKGVFIVSDTDWRDVLTMIPVTTFTQQAGDQTECQRGYGTPDDVCVYPTLIYHEENSSYSDYHADNESMDNETLYFDIVNSRFVISRDSIYAYGKRNGTYGIYYYNLSADYDDPSTNETGNELVHRISGSLDEIFFYDPYVIWTSDYNEEDRETLFSLDIRTDGFTRKSIGEYTSKDSKNQIYMSDSNVVINSCYTNISQRCIVTLLDYNTMESEELFGGYRDYEFSGSCTGDDEYIVCYVKNGDLGLFLTHSLKTGEETEISLLSWPNRYPYYYSVSDGRIIYTSMSGSGDYEVISTLDIESRFNTIVSKYGGVILDRKDELILLLRDGEIYELSMITNRTRRVSDGRGSYVSARYYERGVFLSRIEPDGKYVYYTTDDVNHKRTVVADNPIDADSMIYFMQQYDADKVTSIGYIPSNLRDLLLVSPTLGAGINNANIKEIREEEKGDILSYWENYENVVYVENDYELALLASAYASLINAPLIIEGSALDEPKNLEGREIICVGSARGSVSEVCDKRFDISQLREEYARATGTDKLILVNPEDLDMRVIQEKKTERTGDRINNLYSKTSLASPILAGAKHELILSIRQNNYTDIKEDIEDAVKSLMPQIINNSQGILRNNTESPTMKLYQRNMGTSEENYFILLNGFKSGKIMESSGHKILFFDGAFYIYDTDEQQTEEIVSYQTDLPGFYDIYGDYIIFSTYSVGNCQVVLLNISNSTAHTQRYLASGESGCRYVAAGDGRFAWIRDSDSGRCYHGGQECESNSDCVSLCYDSFDIYESDSDCNVGDNCYQDFCKKDVDLYMYDYYGTRKIAQKEIINDLEMYGDNIVFKAKGGDETNYHYYSNIYLYNIPNNRTEVISGSIYDVYVVDMWDDYVLLYNNLTIADGSRFYNIALYNIRTKEDISLEAYITPNTNLVTEPRMDDGKVVWTTESADKGYTVNIYHINSSHISTIEVDNDIFEETEIIGDDIIYKTREIYDSYVSGFLTIFGSPDAIPHRALVARSVYSIDYRSLDHTGYGDIYKDDGIPDMSVGRIEGMSLTDVSSYLARDIFYNRNQNRDRTMFLASSFRSFLEDARVFNQEFSDNGYDSSCSVRPTQTYDTTDMGCQVDDGENTSWPDLWKDKDMITYMDHGASNWAGIYSGNIPYLDDTLVLNHACSTCSTHNHDSFCNTVIRKGGIANIGNVGITWTGSKLYKYTLDGIYRDYLTIGEAFAKAYQYDRYSFMTNLLGDPTLYPYIPYKMEAGLPWIY